jgi:hypothetical protein
MVDQIIADVVEQGVATFTPEIDRLIVEISKLGGKAELVGLPMSFYSQPMEKLESDLVAVRDRLKA